MELLIKGWSSKGLRCPDVDIDLRQSISNPKVSVCMVPNGTGKTTTINLIKSAMSLELFLEKDSHTPSGYRGNDNTDDYGEFELRMAIADGTSEKKFHVRIEFNFSHPDPNKVARFQTRTEDGLSIVGKPNPPEEITKFLNPENANIFNISGEIADVEPDKAISAVCGLGNITDLIEDIDEYYNKQAEIINRKTHATATAARGFGLLRNRLEKANEHLKKIKEIKKDAATNIKQLDSKIKKLEKEIGSKKGKQKELEKKQQTAERDKLDADKILNTMTIEFLDRLRNPLFFSDEFKVGVRNFKDRLDRLKLPDNVARAWFDELLEEEDCICGNPIDENAKENIKEKRELVLEQGFQTTLNTFKTNFDKLNIKSLEKDEFLEKYEEAKKASQTAKSQLKRAKENFKQAQERSVQEKIDELETLKKDKSESLGAIKKYSEPAEPGEVERKVNNNSFDDIESEDVMQKVVQRLNKDFTSIEEVRILKEKTDLLKHLCEQLKIQSLTQIRGEITEALNNKLEKSFGDDLMFRVSSIREDGFSFDRGIEDDEGSQGQMRTLRYSFVSSLLDRAQSLVPLVVDHPTAALDNRRRREFAGNISTIDNQLLFFLIDNEKAAFLETLESNNSLRDRIAYICFFKTVDDPDEIKEARKLEQQEKAVVLESKNGVVVHGKPFFDLFSIKDEKTEVTNG